jgi:hypothetical protein
MVAIRRPSPGERQDVERAIASVPLHRELAAVSDSGFALLKQGWTMGSGWIKTLV